MTYAEYIKSDRYLDKKRKYLQAVKEGKIKLPLGDTNAR